MNRLIGTLCLLISLEANAQYYYKDIVVSRQTIATKEKYKSLNIAAVDVISYEPNGERTQDFSGQQVITSTRIKTNFNTPMSGESELNTIFDGSGRLSSVTDSADGSSSRSQYLYYGNTGSLQKISNVSVSSGQRSEQEDHLWLYNGNGQPEKMFRIKNGVDTTFVTFVPDERGNVAEEHSRRGNVSLPAYYYYYDDKNRLTDVVSYNNKAKRLLPLYIFEYTNNDLIKKMIVVPEGTDDYQTWVYEYNADGLKTKETAFNKKRQVLGRIEYVYKNTSSR
ncbi:MAG: hypothetical protein JNK79_18735 [Chitinophagaceae bacterium]|nr:hypothetical protein [Chitinophagaceae bacterium]